GNDTGNDTATATANITARPITVTAVAAPKPYDGTTASSGTPTVSWSGTGPAIVAPDSASFFETFDTKNAGTGKTLTPAGSVSDGNSGKNYLATFIGVSTGRIDQLGLTGSITAADKVYDGTTAATITGRTLSGVVSGDDVTYVGGTATFADKNAGTTGKTVTGTGLSLSGTDAGNYTVNSAATTTAHITPRPITVTADARS